MLTTTSPLKTLVQQHPSPLSFLPLTLTAPPWLYSTFLPSPRIHHSSRFLPCHPAPVPTHLHPYLPNPLHPLPCSPISETVQIFHPPHLTSPLPCQEDTAADNVCPLPGLGFRKPAAPIQEVCLDPILVSKAVVLRLLIVMMGWMVRPKDMARLVLDVGFWKGKGRGRRDVFVGVWVLGGCGGWGTFFLRVAFWRGWVSGVACLGMRNSCR